MHFSGSDSSSKNVVDELTISWQITLTSPRRRQRMLLQETCHDCGQGQTILGMALNMDFADEAIERLIRVASGVRGRKMFGGVGIYSGETFFALVAYDRLWFKVDESNRIGFEVRGMKPFQPFPDRPMTMSYYELPPALLDDEEKLRVWTERSIAIARSAKKAKRPRVSTRRQRVAKK